MKPQDIKVGSTYRNRGVGRTKRKVIAIGNEFRPKNYFNATGQGPDEPGVLFEQANRANDKLYLSSFAQWAGSEVGSDKLTKE